MYCAVQQPCLLILANLQINKRQKKEKLRFNRIFFAYMHPSKRESFPSYKIFGQVTAKSQNYVTGVVEGSLLSLLQSQIFEGIRDKNSVVPKHFFWMVFRDEIMASYLARGDILTQSCLLTDKPSIKLTDTRVGHKLRM